MGIFSRPRHQEVLRCAFCKETQDVVAKLISSPNRFGQVYICDGCVRVCIDTIHDEPRPSGRRSLRKPCCSYCRKGSDVVRLQSSTGDPPNASICEECLAVCTSILQGYRTPKIQPQLNGPTALRAATALAKRTRKPMNAAARRKITTAQKRRWAEYRKKQKAA